MGLLIGPATRVRMADRSIGGEGRSGHDRGLTGHPRGAIVTAESVGLTRSPRSRPDPRILARPVPARPLADALEAGGQRIA